MAKFWILAVLAVVALVQNAQASDVAEALNVNIRAQLNLFDIVLKEEDSAKYADELKKLIKITEGALKAESFDEKTKIIASQPSHFSAEFNSFINAKLKEAQINSDIYDAIGFYSSLLRSHSDHEAEIKNTITTLENILRETDLKQKEEKFFSFEKSFSVGFQKFLKENADARTIQQLQNTAEFFRNLLNEKDIKFAEEIAALKTKTEAALEKHIPIDEKNKVLHEVTYTGNQQLNEFLQQKNLEYS